MRQRAMIATHDLEVVAGCADRVIVMYAGKAVETGSAEDVFYQPRMPYTLGLLGSIPRLDSVKRQVLTPIEGSAPSLVTLPVGCPLLPDAPAKSTCASRSNQPLNRRGMSAISLPATAATRSRRAS
jgi:glutathione transport system ATP-binding protein